MIDTRYYNGIASINPHRYPFAFVDCLLHEKEEKKIRGIKNISCNDRFQNSGTSLLICESLAQLSKLLDHKMSNRLYQKSKVSFLTRIDVKWFGTVKVGDRVFLDAEFVREVHEMRSYKVSAEVEGKIILSGSIFRKIEEGQVGKN